jgi:flavorubredoxin
MTRIDNKVLEVSPDVKWIGVLDFDIVTFDVVMETKYGTTYNSYLINADKPAIVETSKEKFWDVYLAKIRSQIDPASIEYIILNHTEPDHSGNVRNLLMVAPNATVVGSGNAIRYMKDLMGVEFKHLIVKDGDILSLGNKHLTFISAPNLHWPDSMYTWLAEDRLLFTCDSFGAHFCHEEMYDDKVGNYDDAFRYYFDVILKPFSRFMLKAIEKIKHLDIECICTGHGPILRSTWKEIVERSRVFSEEALQYPEKQRVFIPYVSAYHKTAMLAEALAEGVRSAGDIEVEVRDIEMSGIGELDEELTRSTGFLVGCPTINQNILLPIYKLFALISPLRDKGKLAAGFGSYGWSGENQTLINSSLTNLKLKVLDEGVFVKFTPDEEDLVLARQFGKRFGEELLKTPL